MPAAGRACCALCDSTHGIKHTCEVCQKKHCRSCCKRYLALASSPEKQVRACNECFVANTAWDATCTHDEYGGPSSSSGNGDNDDSSSKPVVVLVHGALVGRQCLVLEAHALAEAGFRVLVPDLPAHGARYQETPLTLDNAVETLRELIQQEAAGKKVVMMGFSMGGYVAAAFAARHPGLVAGVLLAACCHDTHTTSWRLVGRLAEAVYRVCSYKTKSQVMSPSRPEIQECFTRAGAEFDSWKWTWRVMYDADMHELLPQITCPALLVVGEHDYRDSEQKWLSLLPRGRLLVLPGGLHQFMCQPELRHEWRTQAQGFATAAAADGGGQAAPHGEEGAAATPAAGLPAPQQPQAASAGRGGVGVGAVVSNVLAQFRRGR